MLSMKDSIFLVRISGHNYNYLNLKVIFIRLLRKQRQSEEFRERRFRLLDGNSQSLYLTVLVWYQPNDAPHNRNLYHSLLSSPR